jgi:hypothetical protein
MDPYILFLALYWRKILLFLAFVVVLSYLSSCFGG